jgi:hypothetical protein
LVFGSSLERMFAVLKFSLFLIILDGCLVLEREGLTLLGFLCFLFDFKFDCLGFLFENYWMDSYSLSEEYWGSLDLDSDLFYMFEYEIGC